METETEPEVKTETEVVDVPEAETAIPPLQTVSNSVSATQPGEFPCCDCDFVAKNKLGLAKHRSARHGVISAKKKPNCNHN